MKAPDIQYYRPVTLGEALVQLSDETIDCQPLAGGQSLLPMMHLRIASPECLLDLSKLSELNFINKTDSHIEIGAVVTYSELAASTLVQQHVPLFSLAIPHIAHSAIRNRGTIGGSTALADPAAEMPALLIALDATINVVSHAGSRQIPAVEFFLGLYETELQQSELVQSISVPIAKADQRFGFYELTRRHGDYAMAGTVISADSVEPYAGMRIVFFGVGEKALRAPGAEAALNGCRFNDFDALKQAQASLSNFEFYEDINASEPIKLHLAKVTLKRALTNLVRENS